MRRQAQELGVQAMSLYHHVPNKENLLDRMVDAVYAEVDKPAARGPWREAMARRARSAREVLNRHRWATPLMDSRREPGPSTLGHHEAVLDCLRVGGFSVALAAHAFSLLDAYIFGFVLQEQALPFESPDEARAVATAIGEQMGDAYPRMTEMLTQHVLKGDYDYALEFDYGLELILEGLEQRYNAALDGSPATITATSTTTTGGKR
jgi:AcrR family transcriptional regulator